MTENDPVQQVKLAISHFRLGHRTEARRILAMRVQENPEDVNALLWLAKCAEASEQIRWCLEKIMEVEPGHAAAQAALRRLRQGKEPFPEIERYRQRKTDVAARSAVPERRLQSKQPLIRLAVPALALLVAGLILFSLFTNAPEGASFRASTPTVFLISGTLSSPLPSTSPTSTPTTTPTAVAQDWKKLPVVPEVNAHAREIFLMGAENGADPMAFSVIGDCHSDPEVLFGRLVDPEFTLPEEYAPYRETLDQYQDSWGRYFVTVKNGMSVASVLSPYWNDKSLCDADETPLACEIRLHNPSVIIISLGTNWLEDDDQKFEDYYRGILDAIVKEGIVPVIVTKADPSAPDFPLNQIMVRLAAEYDVPLWNFWAAVQDLPDHGLDVDYEEGHHLLHEAWEVKRWTGVQALDAVRRAVMAGGQ